MCANHYKNKDTGSMDEEVHGDDEDDKMSVDAAESRSFSSGSVGVTRCDAPVLFINSPVASSPVLDDVCSPLRGGPLLRGVRVLLPQSSSLGGRRKKINICVYTYNIDVCVKW
jgi:hypothetical protein